MSAHSMFVEVQIWDLHFEGMVTHHCSLEFDEINLVWWLIEWSWHWSGIMEFGFKPQMQL